MSQPKENHEKLMKDIGTVTAFISDTNIKGLDEHVAHLYDDLKVQKDFHKVKYNLDLMEFVFLERLGNPVFREKYASLKDNIRKARIRAYDRLHTWDKEFKDRDPSETETKIRDDIKYQIGVTKAEAKYATDRLNFLLDKECTAENFKYAYMSAMLSRKYAELCPDDHPRLSPDSPGLYGVNAGNGYIERLLVDPIMVKIRELKVDGALNERNAIASYDQISSILGMLESFFGRNFKEVSEPYKTRLFEFQYSGDYESHLRLSTPPSIGLPTASR